MYSAVEGAFIKADLINEVYCQINQVVGHPDADIRGCIYQDGGNGS